MVVFLHLPFHGKVYSYKVDFNFFYLIIHQILNFLFHSRVTKIVIPPSVCLRCIRALSLWAEHVEGWEGQAVIHRFCMRFTGKYGSLSSLV